MIYSSLSVITGVIPDHNFPIMCNLLLAFYLNHCSIWIYNSYIYSFYHDLMNNGNHNQTDDERIASWWDSLPVRLFRYWFIRRFTLKSFQRLQPPEAQRQSAKNRNAVELPCNVAKPMLKIKLYRINLYIQMSSLNPFLNNDSQWLETSHMNDK